jgi:hypothetical protein
MKWIGLSFSFHIKTAVVGNALFLKTSKTWNLAIERFLVANVYFAWHHASQRNFIDWIGGDFIARKSVMKINVEGQSY